MAEQLDPKECQMSIVELWAFYDRGYRVGYEGELKEIEIEDKNRRRVDIVLQKSRCVPPRIRTREDFSRNPMEQFTGPYEDHVAWFVGHHDGEHVAEIDAGAPCQIPNCCLCHPSNTSPPL